MNIGNLFLNEFLVLALIPVSEEVRSRCHLKHSASRATSECGSVDNVHMGVQLNAVGIPTSSTSPATSPSASPHRGHSPSGRQLSGSSTPVNRRQKSWDLLDQTAIAQARLQKQTQVQSVSHLIVTSNECNEQL